MNMVKPHHAGRSSRRALAILLACCATLAIGASGARADFTLEEFHLRNSSGDIWPNNIDTPQFIPGKFSRQAGAHANLSVRLKFGGTDSLRNVIVDLPPGLIGNPTVVPKCPTFELTAGAGRNSDCPADSQVGAFRFLSNPEEGPFSAPAPIYNLTTSPDQPALFGFTYSGEVIFIEPHIDPTDYSIYTVTPDTSIAIDVRDPTVKFWNVPADSSHDAERGADTGIFTGKVPSQSQRIPFLTNPTSCPSKPTPFTVEANSWQDESFVHDEVGADVEGTPFLWEGCDQLPFEPSLRVTPGSHAAAQPSGLEVAVDLPYENGATGLAEATPKKIKVTLPAGYKISAAAAAGIGGCSEAQIGFGNNNPPTCPGSSALGTVKVKSPLLEEELDGELFLAKQNENPFHSLLAIYMAIKGPGFYIKVAGQTDMDPVTGQVTSTFDKIPQLPFESIKLQFRGGAKAPLVGPDKCGIYYTEVEATSWASAIPVNLKTPLTINENCNTGGFDPDLHGASTNPVAGRNTPFNVQFVRTDGEQNISRVEATLPPGLVASIAGTPRCEGVAAETGNCPPASDIGAMTLAAGAGPSPLFIPEPGKARTHIYFGGPYKGAPYSMVFMVPAQAGPFDLGNVVVRAAVYIDPTTAQVSIKSDPLPQILQGIPVQYRDVRIEVTKPSFTLNPTNCEPSAFTSTVTSVEGAVRHPVSRFQVTDCASLAFKPTLKFSLSGGTRRAAYPALKAVLTQPPHQANLARVSAALPHSEFLANEHIRTICTRVQYAAESCPAKAIYGHATAYSPILDKPLTGPVYLRSSNHTLPDLVADLGGELHIDLVGRVDSLHGGIRTTFENIPDAPVSRFVLRMEGGEKGLLVNSRNLCKESGRATVRVDGQNGKTADQRPPLRVSCGKHKTKKRGR